MDRCGSPCPCLSNTNKNERNGCYCTGRFPLFASAATRIYLCCGHWQSEGFCCHHHHHHCHCRRHCHHHCRHHCRRRQPSSCVCALSSSVRSVGRDGHQ